MRKSELEKDAGGRVFSSNRGETRLENIIISLL